MQKVGLASPIQVASDGQQAIDYLKGAGEFADRETFPLPCLVLLDLKLPRVMGLDVLKWIRQQPPALVVIVLTASAENADIAAAYRLGANAFLTASAENADIAAAYRLGANAFLTKPPESGKLEDMAKAIKDFWLTHNSLPRES